MNLACCSGRECGHRRAGRLVSLRILCLRILLPLGGDRFLRGDGFPVVLALEGLGGGL